MHQLVTGISVKTGIKCYTLRKGARITRRHAEATSRGYKSEHTRQWIEERFVILGRVPTAGAKRVRAKLTRIAARTEVGTMQAALTMLRATNKMVEFKRLFARFGRKPS